MFSAVMVFSRGLVNLWYGRQKLKSVSIGTVWRPDTAGVPSQGLRAGGPGIASGGGRAMEFSRSGATSRSLRHALVFNAISFVTFAAAVFFLATRGLHCRSSSPAAP